MAKRCVSKKDHDEYCKFDLRFKHNHGSSHKINVYTAERLRFQFDNQEWIVQVVASTPSNIGLCVRPKSDELWFKMPSLGIFWLN